MSRINKVDSYLNNPPLPPNLQGHKRFFVEFLFFGLKEARASLFAGLFFAAVFLVPREGIFNIPRYDLSRCTVYFQPLDKERKMPLLVAFILIGFFIWLAENLSTFFSIWQYPNQLGAWSLVHISKWSSWSLLVIMTFTIVANLKHIKHTIDVPK